MDKLGTLDYTTIGAWILAVFYLLEKVALPLIGRFIPLRQKITEREQARLDSKLKHEQDIETRQVRATEKTAEAVQEISSLLKLIDARMTLVEASERNTASDVSSIKTGIGEIKAELRKTKRVKP